MEYSQKNLFPCQQTIIAEISVIRQNQLPKTRKKFYTERKVKTTSSLTSFTISSLILARSASLLPLSRSTSLFFLRPTSPFTSSDLKVYKSIHIFKLIIDRAIWKSMSGENPMPKIWALGGGFHHKVRLSRKQMVIYDCKYDEKNNQSLNQ